MLHPVLGLIATQPQLLIEHAEAYADLVADDIGALTNGWRRRLALSAVALCCVGVAAVLAGVAVMLWALTPALQLHAAWVLIAVPLAPCVVALCCLIAMRARNHRGTFSNLREQVQADLAMLREVSQS